MPSSNISDWEPIESESEWEPVDSGGDWEPLSPREEKKLSLKAQQQAIAAQGETSTLRGLDAELADRFGQLKKGFTGVLPAALKTLSTIGSQPAYESEMLTEGAVTPKPQVIPEAQPLFQLGEMAQERINQVWPDPESRDVWHDVARGAGQVGQMVAGGAVAKGLGAGTVAAQTLAIASGAVQEFDDAFSRSRLRGDDPDTALAKSLGYSTVAAMIESRLGAGRLLRQLYPSAKEAAKKLTALGVSKRLLGNFVAGGAEEGAQRVAQNWIVEGEPSMEGVTEEAIPGAIVQGIIGAPGAAVQPGQSPTAEFLRRANAPATAAVAEEINLPLLTLEQAGEVAPKLIPEDVAPKLIPEEAAPTPETPQTGKPIKATVYRGSDKGEGVDVNNWFSSNETTAKEYSDKKGGELHSFDVDLKNPKVLEFEESTAENLYTDWRKDGHDGLIVKQKDGSFTGYKYKPESKPTAEDLMAEESATQPKPEGKASEIDAAFNEIAKQTAAFFNRVKEQVARGERVTFTKPRAIELARQDPRYQLKDNPDGSVDVIGISESPSPVKPATTSRAEVSPYSAEQSNPLQDIISKAFQRMADEARGQEILDGLDDKRTPKTVVSEFWSETYPQLPDVVKRRFHNYIKRETGLKPGDVVAVGPNNEEIIAKEWSEVYGADQASENAEYLEGTERGLIALMEVANKNRSNIKALGAPLSTKNVPAGINAPTPTPAGQRPTPGQSVSEPTPPLTRTRELGQGGGVKQPTPPQPVSTAGRGAEKSAPASSLGVPPIVSEMISTAQTAAASLREKISDVKPAKYVEGQKFDTITFTLEGKTYKAELKGRNRDLVLGASAAADRAVAVRAFLDGDAVEISPTPPPAKVKEATDLQPANEGVKKGEDYDYSNWESKEQILGTWGGSHRLSARQKEKFDQAGIPWSQKGSATLGSKKQSVTIPNTPEALQLLKDVGGTIARQQWDHLTKGKEKYTIDLQSRSPEQSGLGAGAAPSTGKITPTEAAPKIEGKSGDVVPQPKTELSNDDIYTRQVQGRGEMFLVPSKENLASGKRGFGDSIFETRADAEKYIEQTSRIQKANAEYQASVKSKAEAEASAKAVKDAPINEYLASTGLDSMRQGKLKVTLETQVAKRASGGKSYRGSRAEVVRQMIADGYNPTTEQVAAIKEPTRTQWNRMDGRQQADFEARKKDAGTNTEYRLALPDGSWFDVTKAEHDYAQYLTEKSKASQPKIEGTTGSRVKLSNSPQTYTVLETLPQTEVEKSNGEQPVRIKNERTGKEEVVLQSELTEVAAKTEGTAKPKRTKADLNKALKDAGLDPSVFPDAKSKKNALDRAIAKMEQLQDKLRKGERTNLDLPRAVAMAVVDVAWGTLKLTKSIAKALDAAIAKARELMAGTPFDEDLIRGQLVDELTKSERKETQSTTMTGEYETSSRSRQVIAAEKFSEGKTPEQVIREVALFNAGESVPGLSDENVAATLALTMENLFKIVATSKNPIEVNDAANLIGRAQSLYQQHGSKTAQAQEANKVARERLGFMAPWLAFRGLAKKAWARALQTDENVDDPEAGVNNIVKDSGKKATKEVEKDVDSLNVDAVLMKVIRDSGINLSTLFMDNDHASQSARRKHLFEQIRQKFPNLSTEQKLKLEKALMDAWEKARLKIFRQQFKKFVGLPEVAKDNIMDAVQPELIRQANLGTLDDEAFRAAVAKKLGLPQMDGATAKRMIELAQEAQAKPEGVLRNKVFAKMVNELGLLNQFHPFDIARDYWYANALSGTRTWVAVLSSLAHGATLASQRSVELALKGRPKAAAQLAWAYVLDIGEGVANAWDVVKTGDYTRRAEYGQNIDALLRGKGRLDTLEQMKKNGDRIWKKALGQTAYARRMIIGLDYISAIATRGSEIIYGAALNKDAQQLELALKRFNREAAKQAKQQAQVELGPGAKWVDVRARQLEILNEGVQQSIIDQATLMGEVVALNAPLIGATGAVHEIFKSFPRAIQAAKIPGTQKSADAIAFAFSTVIGSPFIRATLNMVANASNYMPMVGGLNYLRSGMNPDRMGYLKFLALVDNEGKPLSPQRRNSILAAQLYGIAMTGAAYLLAKAGDDDEEKDKPRRFDITGTWKGMPSDERKARMAKGERPLSLVINGRYVNYSTQPMAGALVIAGNLRDKDRAEGTPDNTEENLQRMFEVMISGPAYIKDLSTLSGMSAMAGWGAMRTDDATWFNRILAAQGRNVATAVVPFASLVREIDTWFDPKIYRPKEPLHFWIANVPWMRPSSAHGPEYNMAGIPTENYLTPQSRMVTAKPNDPLVLALGQLIENGVTPKYPSTGGWIKDGVEYTATEKGALTYQHQTETLKKWREVMLPMKDEIAKMTEGEYEEFYKKELLPISQEIHGEIQDKLDPNVLIYKGGKYQKSPNLEMKEKK